MEKATVTVYWGSKRRTHLKLDRWEMRLIKWHEISLPGGLNRTRLINASVQGFLLDIGEMIPSSDAKSLHDRLGASYSSLIDSGQLPINPEATYASLCLWCEATNTPIATQITNCLRRTLETMYKTDLRLINGGDTTHV